MGAASMSEELQAGMVAELQLLRCALAESVKLQSHYAAVLNYYDGGKRRQFTLESWIARLKEIGKCA